MSVPAAFQTAGELRPVVLVRTLPSKCRSGRGATIRTEAPGAQNHPWKPPRRDPPRRDKPIVVGVMRAIRSRVPEKTVALCDRGAFLAARPQDPGSHSRRREARTGARSNWRGERDARIALPKRLHAVRPLNRHITRSLTQGLLVEAPPDSVAVAPHCDAVGRAAAAHA